MAMPMAVAKRRGDRVMGMREASYWSSYFLADGVVMGFFLSLLITVLSSIMGLYHNLGAGYNDDDSYPDFFGLFLLLFLSTLAMTTMAFAISACFDTPQTAAMCAFACMIAGVVVFALFLLAERSHVRKLALTRREEDHLCEEPSLRGVLGLGYFEVGPVRTGTAARRRTFASEERDGLLVCAGQRTHKRKHTAHGVVSQRRG